MAFIQPRAYGTLAAYVIPPVFLSFSARKSDYIHPPSSSSRYRHEVLGWDGSTAPSTRASAPRRPDFRRQPRRSHCDSPCTSSQLTEEHKLSLSLSLSLSCCLYSFVEVDLVPRQLSVSCYCLRRCVTNSSCSISSPVCTVCMSVAPESWERHPTGQNRFFRRMISSADVHSRRCTEVSVTTGACMHAFEAYVRQQLLAGLPVGQVHA